MKLAVLEPNAKEKERLMILLRHYLSANHDDSEIDSFSNFEDFQDQFEPSDYNFIILNDETFTDITPDRLKEALTDDNSKYIVVHGLDFKRLSDESFRFIERPISIELFSLLLDSELMDYYTDSRRVKFEVGKVRYEIPMNEILYVNIEEHQTIIHTTTGERIPLRMTFGRFLDLVNFDPRFMICNRNLVINMDKIKEISEDKVIMEDDTIITLKRNIQKRSLTQWMEYEERKQDLKDIADEFR